MKKLIPLVAAAFVFVGCDDNNADFDLDNAANETENMMEDAGDAIRDGVDEAGDKLENAAEETRKGLEEAGDEIDVKMEVDLN